MVINIVLLGILLVFNHGAHRVKMEGPPGAEKEDG